MKKSKTKKKGTKPDQKKSKPAPSQPDETNENPFDFGGLPNRDLKKTLGCG
jgi:hypothetical protein